MDCGYSSNFIFNTRERRAQMLGEIALCWAIRARDLLVSQYLQHFFRSPITSVIKLALCSYMVLPTPTRKYGHISVSDSNLIKVHFVSLDRKAIRSLNEKALSLIKSTHYLVGDLDIKEKIKASISYFGPQQNIITHLPVSIWPLR